MPFDSPRRALPQEFNLPFGTSCSFMNSLTLLSISWYLAVAEYICWKIVVTLPKMVAYSNAAIWKYWCACVTCVLCIRCVHVLFFFSTERDEKESEKVFFTSINGVTAADLFQNFAMRDKWTNSLSKKKNEMMNIRVLCYEVGLSWNRVKFQKMIYSSFLHKCTKKEGFPTSTI